MDDNSNHKQLLLTPLHNLALTETFKLRSKLMGFKTLEEILSSDFRQIIKHEDYSEHWYFELLNLLDRYELTDMLTNKD